MASVPVGTILAYAGPPLDGQRIGELVALGWLVCDGSAYGKSTYPDLARVIGATWGTAPESFEFLVPDLRKQFLRGTTPDRGANNPQGYSTAAPATAFQAKLQASGGSYKSYSKYTCIHAIPEKRVWREDLTILETGRPGGGDAETLPTHAEVVWLVSHSDLVNGSPVPVPEACTIASMSDAEPPAGWELADGAGSAPDLRGLFLRGSADARSTNLTRIPFTTGWPVGEDTKTITLAQAPTTTNDSWGKGLNRKPLKGTSSGPFVAHLGTSGGDDESRPANVAADILYATENVASLGPATIVAYAADGDPNADGGLGATTWLKCDGTPVAEAEFPALAAAMPWAVVGATIHLPNLSDQFVRATDRGASVDPGPRTGAGGEHGQGTTQEDATGRPTTPWQLATSVSTSDDTKADGWASNQSVLRQSDEDVGAADSFTASVSGWDSETRPANVAVGYWIAAS